MSRNSKNASRLHAAREISTNRKAGLRGPGHAKTQPKHGKEAARRHYSTTSREAPKARPGTGR